MSTGEASRLVMVLGHPLDHEEQHRITAHPAASPPPRTCRLLALPPEVRSIIYESVSEDFAGIGIASVSATTSYICAHPLAFTCRQIRKEFLTHLEIYRLPKTASLFVRVVDYDFSRLMDFLSSNPQLGAGHQGFDLRIRADLTREDVCGGTLSEWLRYKMVQPGVVITYEKSRLLPPRKMSRKLFWGVFGCLLCLGIYLLLAIWAKLAKVYGN